MVERDLTRKLVAALNNEAETYAFKVPDPKGDFNVSARPIDLHICRSGKFIAWEVKLIKAVHEAEYYRLPLSSIRDDQWAALTAVKDAGGEAHLVIGVYILRRPIRLFILPLGEAQGWVDGKSFKLYENKKHASIKAGNILWE